MSTNTQTDDVPHSRYTATNKKAFGSQREVTNAWLDGEYPTHNTSPNGRADLYSSDNFRAVQRRDGSGEVWHYSTCEAIRTPGGLVINNHQCWAGGFAHCSAPHTSERDGVFPFDAGETVMDSFDGMVDVVEVFGESPSDGVIVVVDGTNGRYAVFAGRDPSAHEGERHFVMRLGEDEAVLDPESVTDELLTPDAVAESDRDVVTSTAYRRTYLGEDEIEAHRDAGGHTCRSESRWRDRQINYQFYRADLQGETIVRQGEWFFIPRPDVSDDDVTASNRHVPDFEMSARTELGSHRAYDSAGRLDDGTIVVRGRIGHSRNDHHMIHLGDTWHEAVTHDRDCLTYDDSPGRGMGRGGWD